MPGAGSPPRERRDLAECGRTAYGMKDEEAVVHRDARPSELDAGQRGPKHACLDPVYEGVIGLG